MNGGCYHLFIEGKQFYITEMRLEEIQDCSSLARVTFLRDEANIYCKKRRKNQCSSCLSSIDSCSQNVFVTICHHDQHKY